MRRTTTDRRLRMGMLPPHPGTFVRTEILAPLGLTVTAGAQALGVSRVALSSLLNGQADLSGDMAVRIEKAFGVDFETLMRMQGAYDIALTRQRAKTITVRRYRPSPIDGTPDDENPEWTEEMWAQAKPATEVFPAAMIARHQARRRRILQKAPTKRRKEPDQ